MSKFIVHWHKEVCYEGTSIIEADSLEEAEEMIEWLDDYDVEWDEGEILVSSPSMDVEEV